MKHLKIFSTIVMVLITSVTYAQKGLVNQANKYFQAEKYQDALKLYDQIEKVIENKDLLYKRGVANYHSNKIDDAIRDFSIARRLGFEESEIYFYAARALHTKGEYLDATQFYKNYLRYLDDKNEQHQIVELIKQCKFAYNNEFNDQSAFVENLGPSVNTEYNEWNPVQSPGNQNKYYFSSNRSGAHGGLRNKKGYKDEIYGKYSADMYAVELSNGNWTAVSAFHPILNGPKHDLIQGFNPDGSVLYFLKTQSKEAGQIYADTFAIDKDPEAFPKILSSPVVAELGDKDMRVFNNNTIIFASKRMGGYGGYDLYVTVRNEGEWSAPENLGPEINSAYNETAPYLAKSGAKLFFSSDNIQGFGGTDIFSSQYDINSKKWSAPENLGVPINSSRDENHFSISSDGMTAVFSSDRLDSYGGFDLYLAYYKDQITDQLMYTETLPFVKIEEQADTLLTEIDEVQEEIIEEVVTAPVVKKEFYNKPLYYGNDEIIISPANRSKLNRVKDILIVYPEVSVVLTGNSIQEGMREFDLYFSIKRAEKAAQYLVDNDIDPSRIKVRGLGSNYPHTKNTQGASKLAEKNNRRIDVSFVKVPSNRLAIVNETPIVADAFLDGSSNEYFNTLEGLSYKVEVAKTKQMYKADVIREYDSGVVERDLTDDSYTYSIGLFNNYSNAKQLKGQLLRSGVVDAKILPYMNDILLTPAQVEILKDVYPDLGEYMRFEK